jgi:Arrestin (or S-antigen), C-terminal domain/Arrestin (or S-antigen), N-terminal domain
VYVNFQIFTGFVFLQNDKKKTFDGNQFFVGVRKSRITSSYSSTKALRVNIKGVALSMPRSCLIEKKTIFLSNSEVFQSQELIEGLHKLEFAIDLPKNLPQSFESLKAHIRYRIKAYLDISKDSKHDSSLHVKLNRIEDLNMSPSAITNPYTNQIQHEFGFKGRLTMLISLDHLGFVPGQTMKIKIFYENESSVKIDKTKIVLEQTVRHASDDSDAESFETKTIFEEIEDGCAVNENSTIEKSKILPEDLALTSIRYCNILQIFYDLKIKAIVHGFHNNVSTEIPIVLGTIPIDHTKLKNKLEAGRQKNSNEKTPLVANHITIDQGVNPFAPRQEMTLFQIIFFLIFMFSFSILVIWSFNYERKD